ncbi:uncharacterized protein K452DRAFT_240175 [Aplosporella prunicola CBS 121167]|uniref:Zn(2)-C6 fungal-type domain-containing protein n=1 Tax=Aplosporella prunicola CBS 121167 TaxID=1176127 RepID=A0A6A6BSI7_9PEZI|nr:uncharacterized protein K452DRAFT_240175 [Aplosporella prunicola CBS 121167]KAF2147046.1 hypothetical protein K452DRAFT_240175 [Aplosporella prunicola CBS 121167]
MKVRQRTICHTCRSRKLGCDGKQPACTQCLLRGQQCAGYNYDLIFVSHGTAPANPAKRGKQPMSWRPVKNQSTSVLDAARFGRISPDTDFALSSISLKKSSLEDLIRLVMAEYVPENELIVLPSDSLASRPRICGCWVEVLPSMADKGDNVLDSAIRAFGLALSSGSTSSSISVPQCFEAYSSAIHLTANRLRTTHHSFPDDLAAAIMCLTMAELMLPSSENGWKAHAKGVGELIKLCGPAMFISGVPHKLFVGFRPLLVLASFSSCEATFLDQEEWKSIPFYLHPQVPMQSLLSIAVAIPPIIKKVEILTNSSPPNDSFSKAYNARSAFCDIVRRFEEWELLLSQETAGPLCSLLAASDMHASHVGQIPNHRIRLWFPNISVANGLTHLWAFQIICFVQIKKLESAFPTLAPGNDLPEIFTPSSIRQEKEATNIATKICQSAEYLMQDDMKLYGPASITFPLETALDFFKNDSRQHEEKIAWCYRIYDRLAQKGLYVAPSFFDSQVRYFKHFPIAS